MSNGNQNINADQVYNSLITLANYSEQVRWARLNTFLVVASIFLAAWAGIFAGTGDFQYKEYFLLVLSIPVQILGGLWAVLGWRSSQYLEDFHYAAYDMEDNFNASNLPKPLHCAERTRGKVRSGLSICTSSRSLVTFVPVLFSLFFLVLAFASFSMNKEILK